MRVEGCSAPMRVGLVTSAVAELWRDTPTRKRSANRVSILLRHLAPTIGRTDTWLGIFHRRMKGRLGPGAANTATAHKLALIIYHLLKYKEDYIDVDAMIYQEKWRYSRLNRLKKQAEELGFELVEQQKAA